MLMDRFYYDMAGMAFIIGALGIYYGLSMYKWDSKGWRIPSALMALFGVVGIGYAIAVYWNVVMAIIAVILFGGIVSYALFTIGHENLSK